MFIDTESVQQLIFQILEEIEAVIDGGAVLDTTAPLPWAKPGQEVGNDRSKCRAPGQPDPEHNKYFYSL